MPAYVLAQIDVEDESKYDAYKSAVPATIEQYGGRDVVRGATPEVLSGALELPRVVLIEFPNVERARSWYHSDEYQAIAKLRTDASRGLLMILDGVE